MVSTYPQSKGETGYEDFITYIGLDVHKDSICVAMSNDDTSERYFGQIANTPMALRKLAGKLATKVNCRCNSVAVISGLKYSMAHLAHLVVPGLLHHVTQRGSRRAQTFFENGDYQLYHYLLAEAAHMAGS